MSFQVMFAAAPFPRENTAHALRAYSKYTVKAQHSAIVQTSSLINRVIVTGVLLIPTSAEHVTGSKH